MTNFLAQLAIDSAVLFAFTLPLIIVARRNDQKAHIRRFLIAGAIVVVIASLISASSEQMVERCFAAGNMSCNDFGSAGLRFLLMGGYVAFALIEAYLIACD